MLLLYIAVVLCIVIGQYCMQINATITQSADNWISYWLADNWISYWLADNSVICMLSLLCFFFIVLRAMFIIFNLKSIIKQLLDLVFGFFHLKCIIKQLLDSVFVICKIINVSERVISLAFGHIVTAGLDWT